jgi:hypothetical protein
MNDPKELALPPQFLAGGLAQASAQMKESRLTTSKGTHTFRPSARSAMPRLINAATSTFTLLRSPRTARARALKLQGPIFSICSMSIHRFGVKTDHNSALVLKVKVRTESAERLRLRSLAAGSGRSLAAIVGFKGTWTSARFIAAHPFDCFNCLRCVQQLLTQ